MEPSATELCSSIAWETLTRPCKTRIVPFIVTHLPLLLTVVSLNYSLTIRCATEEFFLPVQESGPCPEAPSARDPVLVPEG